jgi:hypothetical protein
MYGMPQAQGTGTVPDSSSISSIHGWSSAEAAMYMALATVPALPAFPASVQVMYGP